MIFCFIWPQDQENGRRLIYRVPDHCICKTSLRKDRADLEGTWVRSISQIGRRWCRCTQSRAPCGKLQYRLQTSHLRCSGLTDIFSTTGCAAQDIKYGRRVLLRQRRDLRWVYVAICPQMDDPSNQPTDKQLYITAHLRTRPARAPACVRTCVPARVFVSSFMY